jgi:hypothetical protein
MNVSSVETGIANAVRALLVAAGVTWEVRPGAGVASVLATSRYSLVNVLDSNNEVADLYTVRVFIGAVSPRLGPPSLVEGHELFLRQLEGTIRAGCYPLHAAALWEESGYILHGWDIETSDRYKEDGRLVEGWQLVLGVEACLGSAGRALPTSLAEIASPLGQTIGPSGEFDGEQWLVDARYASGPISVTVPSASAQILVPLLGSGISPVLTMWAETPHGTATVEVPAGGLVVLGVTGLASA